MFMGFHDFTKSPFFPTIPGSPPTNCVMFCRFLLYGSGNRLSDRLTVLQIEDRALQLVYGTGTMEENRMFQRFGSAAYQRRCMWFLLVDNSGSLALTNCVLLALATSFPSPFAEHSMNGAFIGGSRNPKVNLMKVCGVEFRVTVRDPSV